jgi:hypothetical protein
VCCLSVCGVGGWKKFVLPLKNNNKLHGCDHAATPTRGRRHHTYDIPPPTRQSTSFGPHHHGWIWQLAHTRYSRTAAHTTGSVRSQRRTLIASPLTLDAHHQHNSTRYTSAAGVQQITTPRDAPTQRNAYHAHIRTHAALMGGRPYAEPIGITRGATRSPRHGATAPRRLQRTARLETTAPHSVERAALGCGESHQQLTVSRLLTCARCWRRRRSSRPPTTPTSGTVWRAARHPSSQSSA